VLSFFATTQGQLASVACVSRQWHDVIKQRPDVWCAVTVDVKGALMLGRVPDWLSKVAHRLYVQLPIERQGTLLCRTDRGREHRARPTLPTGARADSRVPYPAKHALRYCPSLTTLHIADQQGCDVYVPDISILDRVFVPLLEAIEQLPRLTRFTFGRSRFEVPECFAMRLAHISCLAQFTYLDVNLHRFYKTQTQLLAGAYTGLETLIVYGGDNQQESAKELIEIDWGAIYTFAGPQAASLYP